MDVAFKLGETDFQKLSYQQQLIVKERGRPQPVLDIENVGKSRGKTYKRQFNKDVYLRNNWVCGCSDKNALFCFPCVLFGVGKFGYGHDGLSWSKKGVRDLVHLSAKIKKHENSKIHIVNQMRFALFGNVNRQAQLDSAYWINIQKHNEEVTENRYVLSKIIDCIKFCGAFELASLRGLDENCARVNFTSELDKTLDEHIKSASIFKDTSKNIQNDILECMLDVYQAEILNEINEAPFLAMMAHDVSDVSAKFQTAIVLRYVKRDGSSVERFWTLVHSQRRDDMLNIIEPFLKNNGHKLIAQSYDGAAAKHQALVKQTCQNAHFVHCYAHQSNLLMSRACSVNSQVRVFFEDLKDITRFFNNSPQRIAVLDKVLGKGTLITISSFSIGTVNIVYEHKESIIKCMQQLEEDELNTLTCKEARFIRRILEESNFTFWLHFFHYITPHVEALHKQLQKTNMAASETQNAAHVFEQGIINVRNKIDFIIQQASHVHSDQRRATCVEVCNAIINIAKERVAFTSHLVAASLLNSENFEKYDRNFPKEELDRTCSAYNFLNKERLHTELSVLYSNLECRTLHGAVLVLKFLISIRLDEAMTETKKLLQILVTTPMITDEPKRHFPTLKRIKTFFRNSMCDDRSAAALSMLSIERKYVASIPNFNEKLIETFAANKDQGFQLRFNKVLYGEFI